MICHDVSLDPMSCTTSRWDIFATICRKLLRSSKTRRNTCYNLLRNVLFFLSATSLPSIRSVTYEEVVVASIISCLCADCILYSEVITWFIPAPNSCNIICVWNIGWFHGDILFVYHHCWGREMKENRCNCEFSDAIVASIFRHSFLLLNSYK